MDQLARHTLHQMRKESFLSRPTLKSHAAKLFSKFRGKEEVEVVYEDLGFDERIRVSNYGALMLGQEENFKDFLHPDVLPGSYLWGDMFMYE